ncbi:hypothetical protein PLESTB_001638000 [Pleodorina starrii]|uniref:Uncharacterized protein n=1 Tax=Pleodorina starrii TaxID=330485 RepID=A0A9W6F8T5_9CHLO|nr:hypothetical protein PLESTB_001638000 [Pleodorina starrii]
MVDQHIQDFFNQKLKEQRDEFQQKLDEQKKAAEQAIENHKQKAQEAMEAQRSKERDLRTQLEEQRERQDTMAGELAIARSSNLPQCQDPLRLNLMHREQFMFLSELRKNQEVMNNIIEKSADDGSEDFKMLKKTFNRNTQLLDLRLMAFHAAALSATTAKAEFVADYCRRLTPKVGATTGKWGPGGVNKFTEIHDKTVREVESKLPMPPANSGAGSGGASGSGGGGGQRQGGRMPFNPCGGYQGFGRGGMHQGQGGRGGGRGPPMG